MTRTRVAARRVAVATPAALAAVAFVNLLRGLPDMLRLLDDNSDLVTAKLLSLEAAAGHLRGIRFGNYAPYTTLALNVALTHVPHTLGLWLAWPYASYVAAGLLLGVVLWRCVGPAAALVTGALLVALPFDTLTALLVQFEHGPTYVTLVVVLALAVAAPFLRGRFRLVCAVSAAAFLAANLASDSYLFVVVVAPIVATATVLGRLDRPAHRATIRLLAMVGAGGVVGNFVVVAIADAAGIHRWALPVNRPSVSELPSQAATSLAAAVHAEVGFARPTALPSLLWPVAVGAGVAVVAWTVISPAIAVARGESRHLPARLMAAFAVLAVMAATTLNAALDVAHSTGGRYLTAIPIAAAAAVGIGATVHRRAAAVLLAAALVLALSSVVVTREWPAAFRGRPTRSEGIVPKLSAALQRHGVRYGYGPYWDANAMTWTAHGRFVVRPVFACGDGLCRFPVSRADRWYKAKGHRRTFLLIDDAADLPTFMARTPPASLGTPITTFTVAKIRVYVYEGDIAASLKG